MQFIVSFITVLSYFALLTRIIPIIDAAPIGLVLDTLMIRQPSPVPQASDCGVAGSQSCNIIVPETTAPCGVAGSQSCNLVPDSDDATLCGVAGSQSCNITPNSES
ncbi:hypothetical protein Clacol_002121 [Clathrus columnatus]|uniref:Uncharacterized protein n=1 Tax=Clathrus columnatus TaxID=1419009 RepID=A0AAV5A7N3_9AGAM|nr:hypothetical protein Clacol_002121 [Clathrus columnatus]